MRIQVRRGVEGAKAARGTGVIIDVFRTCNTILSLLTRGVDCVIPVACVSVARLLQLENPDYFFCGELEGVTPDSFDAGNSPIEALKLDIEGRTVVMATAAGTKTICHARRTDEMVVASFANARAVADYLKEDNPELVTLLVAGRGDGSPAEEDELCAQYLKALLKGKRPDFKTIKEKILAGAGAARLRQLGQEEDLSFCLTLDSFTLVPATVKGFGLWRFRP